MAMVIQLRKAKTTDIWNFRHSSPKLQCPKSLKNNTDTPPEAEAAARDNVAVTCKPIIGEMVEFLLVITGHNLKQVRIW